MEEKDIILKPKKPQKTSKLKAMLADKKKRSLLTILFILPFLIAMCVFGVIAYKGAKELIDLAKGETEVKDEYKIESMNYALRKNATDVQLEYFTELKNAVEVDGADDATIAGLVCKNFVADFYTWSNKQGQFDISASYYFYTPDKEATYIKARDGFYKYLSNYIQKYGAENLLQVASVNVTKASLAGYPYNPASGETFDKCYDVTCTWTYADNAIFSPSGYATSMNFLVVKREGRFEIAEASQSPIDARESEQQADTETAEEIDNED